MQPNTTTVVIPATAPFAPRRGLSNTTFPCTTYAALVNLFQHLNTHAAKTAKCFGCPRRFSSISAIVLHLEADTCECGADTDYVTDVTFDCFQSGKYTDDESEYNFTCPICGSSFDSIGAILQHAESDCFDEDLMDNENSPSQILTVFTIRESLIITGSRHFWLR